MKRLAGIAAGFAFAIALLICADWSLGRLLGGKIFLSPFLRTPADPEYDRALGYGPAPLSRKNHVTWNGEQKIFDVDYDIDEFRRRVTPARDAPGTPGEYALFFVDSNVFGEGLADRDTVPARFAAKTPRFRSYNYAYRGYGPQQMLAKLEAGFAPGELTESHGAAFYVYFEHHVQRANGFLSLLRWAGGQHPCYRLGEDGTPKRQGSFAECRPFETRLLWWASHSSILRYFKVDWPPRITDRHHELVCALVRESKRRFEALDTRNRFYVILATDGEFARTCLEPHGIAYATLPMEALDPAHTITGDGHWNAAGAELVAEKISDFVNGLAPKDSRGEPSARRSGKASR